MEEKDIFSVEATILIKKFKQRNITYQIASEMTGIKRTTIQTLLIKDNIKNAGYEKILKLCGIVNIGIDDLHLMATDIVNRENDPLYKKKLSNIQTDNFRMMIINYMIENGIDKIDFVDRLGLSYGMLNQILTYGLDIMTLETANRINNFIPVLNLLDDDIKLINTIKDIDDKNKELIIHILSNLDNANYRTILDCLENLIKTH